MTSSALVWALDDDLKRGVGQMDGVVVCAAVRERRPSRKRERSWQPAVSGARAFGQGSDLASEAGGIAVRMDTQRPPTSRSAG